MAKSDQRGTEEQFVACVKALAANAKNYEGKSIAYRGYSEQIDNILADNHWSKEAFYKELNARTAMLGLSMRVRGKK